MKMVDKVRQGKPVDAAFKYLAEAPKLLAAKGPESTEELLDLNYLEKVLATRAAAYVK